MTTYANFVGGLQTMAVTGVTNLTAPPASLNSVTLPAKWVQLPQGREPFYTYTANGGWPTFSADVVVALTPNVQNTQAVNWAEAVAMLDTLAAALRAVDVCKSELSWTIKQTGVTVGEVTYWAIVATVEGNG